MNAQCCLLILCRLLQQGQQANHRGCFACAWAAGNEGEASAQSFGTGDALPVCFLALRAEQFVQFFIAVCWYVKVLRQARLNRRLDGLLCLPSAPQIHTLCLAVFLVGDQDGCIFTQGPWHCFGGLRPWVGWHGK